jgi:hypothetical protein
MSQKIALLATAYCMGLTGDRECQAMAETIAATAVSRDGRIERLQLMVPVGWTRVRHQLMCPVHSIGRVPPGEPSTR